MNRIVELRFCLQSSPVEKYFIDILANFSLSRARKVYDQHFVPRSYFDQFSLVLSFQSCFLAGTTPMSKNRESDDDFYTIRNDDKSIIYDVDLFLTGYVDHSSCIQAFDLFKQERDISEDQRKRFSLVVASMLLRVRAYQSGEYLNDAHEHFELKKFVNDEGMDTIPVLERIIFTYFAIEKGIVPPPSNIAADDLAAIKKIQAAVENFEEMVGNHQEKSKAHFLEYFLFHVMDLAANVYHNDWEIVKAPKDRYFITSDRPCFYTDEMVPDTLMFPLNEKMLLKVNLCLSVHWKAVTASFDPGKGPMKGAWSQKKAGGLRYTSCDPKRLESCNKLVLEKARDRIYGQKVELEKAGVKAR